MNRYKVPVWVLVAAVSLLAWTADGGAQSKLKGFGKTVKIDILDGYVSARDVVIDRGTTVIWHNATAKTVAINFGMGEQVKRACVAPTGFSLIGGIYSGRVPPGGVASLCFVQPGAYQFAVVPEGSIGGEGGEPGKGMITVRKDKPAGA